MLHINHVVDWRYICQRKKTQINKDVTRENTTRIDHDYRVGDKVMTNNRSAYKCKTPLRNPYEIIHMWKNDTVTLLMGSVIHRINIRKHQAL